MYKKNAIIGAVATIGVIGGFFALIAKCHKKKSSVAKLESDIFDDEDYDWDFDEDFDNYDSEFEDEEYKYTDSEFEQVTRLIHMSDEALGVAREILDRKEAELNELSNC